MPAAAVTLPCGSATAAVGVVWFLGMMVPHVARWITGPDQRRILAYSVLLGPVLMVAADVIGRIVVIPDEIAAGVITAVVAEGTPQEVITAETVEHVFDLPCKVVADAVTGTPLVLPLGRKRTNLST